MNVTPLFAHEDWSATPPWEWLRDLTPAWMLERHLLGVLLWQWVGLLILTGLAYLAGALLHWALVAGSRALARRTSNEWDAELVKILPGPLRFVWALLLLEVTNGLLRLRETPQAVLNVALHTALIIVATWFLLRFIRTGSAILEGYLADQVDDAARKRAIHTQIAVPRGILRFVVALLGGALILLQFEIVRNVGVSLLASAGLAGVVIGFAAQRTVANLLAGIQLAIFQPIKIGDSVVVEEEWGWIEEIGLTHVVVKIWDLRRLILPVSYFIDKPFQNWTKTSPT